MGMHIDDHCPSTESTLFFRLDHPRQNIPHIALIAPARKTMAHHDQWRIIRHILVVRRKVEPERAAVRNAQVGSAVRDLIDLGEIANDGKDGL
jgi:hypothetical protein